MVILGIETSCDETSAAVIIDGREIVSNVVFSQVEIHERYGGVVPELASRKHLEGIIPVIEKALRDSSLSIDDIDAIAVTKGPGLIGSLLVGISVAKAIAYAKGIPIIGVNHIHAHIASIFLEYPFISPPLIALVVSGGHTLLFHINESWSIQKIGQTLDDAAGEAFDKVARVLELGYPGGIIIDKMADPERANRIHFPRPMISSNSLDFSFSGLKTAVIHHIKERHLPPIKGEELYDIISSFQEAVVDVLIEKSFRAASLYKTSNIVCTGGVAANSRLRAKMSERGKREGIEVFFPSPGLCTDNAAMVGAEGYRLLLKGHTDSMEMNPFSRLNG
jgi:N6-L-threonylcarbamoyladenine synthase